MSLLWYHHHLHRCLLLYLVLVGRVVAFSLWTSPSSKASTRITTSAPPTPAQHHTKQQQHQQYPGSEDSRPSTAASVFSYSDADGGGAENNNNNNRNGDDFAAATDNNDSYDPVARLISGDMEWNTLVGPADRAFRLGVQLDETGQARQASVRFHEAVTLYQCFLDSRTEFRFVTYLTRRECRTMVAHTCMRLAHLNLDALGDPKAAARLFREAAGLMEENHNDDGDDDNDDASNSINRSSAYHHLGQSLEAAFGEKHLEDAINQYSKALQLQPGRPDTLFQKAVALDRWKGGSSRSIGRDNNSNNDEADRLLDEVRRLETHWSCRVDSWGYVRWHTRNHTDLNIYRGTRDMLRVAIDAAVIQKEGLVCEFGVGRGRSLRMTKNLLPLDVRVHGFDTFTGLPQAWGTEPVGTYSTGGVAPQVEGKVTYHRGLFHDTIRPFVESLDKNVYLAYATIDCRLYSSTRDVLEGFQTRIVPGTILVFDHYIGHPTWRYDEFRAWRECCKRFGWKYEYLAFSLSTNQAVVRVTEA